MFPPMTQTRALAAYVLLAALFAFPARIFGENDTGPVTAEVEILPPGSQSQPATANSFPDRSNIAIWLNPLDTGAASPAARRPNKVPQLVQHNKSFQPHVVVVQVGTPVEFPNHDPFFHNIFSLFEGKRFDLGLYESGSSRTVRFDRPGVSFLFCNIHAEMSAVVLAVDTPYFGLSDRSGNVVMPAVPDGRYLLNVWYERSLPEDLKPLSRRVAISGNARSLGTLRVIENPNFTTAHKNKYGQDYVPPPRSNYVHP